MSTLLQAQAVTFIRSRFTTSQVAEVRPYAGEFSAEEIDKVGWRSPCIMVALLGWRPWNESKRLVGRSVLQARMLAFVVTKAANRDARMQQAAVLAEQLSAALVDWRPDGSDAMAVAPLEEPPTVENLYSRAIDKAGLALWQVDWHQAIKPLVPPAQLWDLLRIEITDHTVQGTVPAAPTPPATPIVVTEDVQFNNLPPAT